MKAKSPIVPLTPTNLDRVTGGCKLASVPSASARSPRPSFGMQVETGLGIAEAAAPLRDLASITEHATSLAADLLGSVDLGAVSDIATQAVGDAIESLDSLPPIWCGPTAGASWGDQSDASDEMDDVDDDDADDDDSDDDDDDMGMAEGSAIEAPMFLDEDEAVVADPERPDFSRPAFDKLDHGAERGEPGSAWGFVDGPPPASAPIHHATEIADTDAMAPAVDANNFFVQGPPPAMAPIRAAEAAVAPPALAYSAAPSSGGAGPQIRDHRR